jgi:hypothetical protein
MAVQKTQPAHGAREAVALPIWRDAEFSAESWLKYFEHNRASRPVLHLAETLSFPDTLRLPLIRSLQRFQVGETGEGKHLRRFARTLKDPAYERCIDLFIKEEQSHARILAEMIAALDGTLLTWHWSDVAFIGLRRMLHLKTEVFVLLIAEVIGKCFYLQCARAIPNERMAAAFSLIVLDEIAHLEFHAEFLELHLRKAPDAIRYFIYWCWAALFYAAMLVFVLDNRKALDALNMSPRDFVRECSKTFNRAATKALTVIA